MNETVSTPACHKKPYRSWQHASNDAKALRRWKNEPERAYYCRKCQAFHVGAAFVQPIRGKRRVTHEA